MSRRESETVNGRLRLLSLCAAALLVISTVPAQAQIASGSYVGNGAGGRKITGLGFRPDVVLVKGNDYVGGVDLADASAVMRSSTMSGDLTKVLVRDNGLVGNQITSIDADGFTLGSDRRVAYSGITFYWTAFKANATMKVGTYTGNGTVDGTTQSITSVGFQPEFVIVMSSGPRRAIQACSETPVGRSYEFDIGVWLANQITSLHAGGFTVNHNAGAPYANENNVVYHYVAWDASPGLVSVGKYDGSLSDKNVLGTGFRPEFLFVKFIYNIAPPDDPNQSPPGHFRNVAMPFNSSWDYARTVGNEHIKDFLEDGFRVGAVYTVNRTYTDCNVDGPGCWYFYVAINAVPLDPPPLATADSGTTITVTAPTSFELSFTSAANGGIQTFYDLVEDSGRTMDLVGGTPGKKAMFYDAIGQGAIIPTWYTSDAPTTGTMHLLEATPTRVRVRSEGFYGSTILAGLKAYGDYSVYPSGRVALRWERRATSAVSHHQQDLNLCLHRSSGTLSNWVPYSQTDGSFLNPATDQFVLAHIDMDLARTDFLQVIDRDWTAANLHQASATSTAYNDPGILYTDEYAVVQWQDDNLSTMPAGSSEAWSFLTYFKPTNLGNHTDFAVTSRSADYRLPAAPTPSPGSVWHDAAENSASDAYNEAEAAYVFDLDPGNGLTFTLDATAGAPRYQPFFKVRQWRSFVDAPTVTLGVTPLAKGVDYLADAKPVARALYAQNIVWYSMLQSDITGMIYLGKPGTSTGGGYVPARYGNGFQVTADGQYLSLPISDFNMAKGAIEFWFQPAYASSDSTAHNIAGFFYDSSNSFLLQKTSANSLVFTIVSANQTSTCTVAAANLSWRASDWVHLRLDWDDSAPLATQQRILINGVEPTHTDPTVDFAYNINLWQVPFIVGKQQLSGGGSTLFSPGIYDELYVYAASSTTPTPLAHGGLASNAEEYLASTSRNSTLSFGPLAGESQGEYFFVGSDSRFRGLNVALQQAGVGPTAADIAWEYWNGTTWADLKTAVGAGNFTDGTNGFTRPTGTVYWTADPPGWSPYSVSGGADLYFVRLHLVQYATAFTTPPVERVIKTDILLFQFTGTLAANGTFAFAPPAPTAVELMSFEATGADGAVDLTWQTGSELDNLGFHLHRGISEAGPWTRITSSVIPGLGSSPLGASYSWRDTGLVNGTRYYYRLEDVDTASVSSFHGPVSAVPGTGTAPATAPSPPDGDGEGDGGADGAEREGPGISSCPPWVLSAAPDVPSPVCTSHGNPDSVSLRILSRDASSATLELHTGGFWALHDSSGTVRVFAPGLEFPSDPRAPALPLRRALVEAVVGKRVELVSANALDVQVFRGLRPAAVGVAEMAVGAGGTVWPARRGLGAPVPSRGCVPKDVARLAGTVFQGDRKSAVVEITPVRIAGQALVLAGTVRVRLAFEGIAEGESGAGSRGRSLPRRKAALQGVLACLHTTRRGLHAVSFEQLFPHRERGLSTALLRLQRQGEAVAFHVEPPGPSFGPGNVLYFFADRTASSTDYSSEVAYELVRSPGVEMGPASGAPVGEPTASPSVASASFETNRVYQPGLLEAPDLWLWQSAISGAEAPPPVSFELAGLDASGTPPRLVVHLQGGSASGHTVDHHVRFLVNGVPAGETTFGGKQPNRTELSIPASVLKEGANELGIVNVADTGVTSLVFLDRFEISYPQASTVRAGTFEGVWGDGGTVEVGGLSGRPLVLSFRGAPIGVGPEEPAVTAVRWMTGFVATPEAVRFQAEAGCRYLVVSGGGLLAPRIERAGFSTVRETGNQADYLVIAPRAFLAAAQLLLERRRGQGLSSLGVAFEEIASEFGHGQPSAEAIREFLSYAYHSWQPPSPRYVLLLGDSTVDPRRFVATSGPSPLPAFWTRTSYMWTVSDPALASVNGEDLVPDLAIGRLPATTVEEAERLVSKVLAWEESAQNLGGEAVLVADDPDRGGDFEADVEDIRASFLSGRPTTVLKVGELAGATRAAILGAFDEGASLMSYVGHGGTTVWASENVLNDWDVPALRAQDRQPLLLTLNCLNGYFVTPNLDALPEALLKAAGRGVIGAFSPSGLSLDGPAHEYHRAVMAELASGEHARVGDAILAAQRTYAETGLMPELLGVYELLADPAMKLR